MGDEMAIRRRSACFIRYGVYAESRRLYLDVGVLRESLRVDVQRSFLLFLIFFSATSECYVCVCVGLYVWGAPAGVSTQPQLYAGPDRSRGNVTKVGVSRS